MKIRTLSASLATAATALVMASPLSANAQTDAVIGTFSNADGSVRCEIYNTPDGVDTICVSDAARDAQPECNPEGELIPAVRVGTGSKETFCWNQGFTQEPEALQPFTIRSAGPVSIFAAPGGDLHLFDSSKNTAFSAGDTNKVHSSGSSLPMSS